MCYMYTEGIKIDIYFRKNLGLYITEGSGSDGSVVKGLEPGIRHSLPLTSSINPDPKRLITCHNVPYTACRNKSTDIC